MPESDASIPFSGQGEGVRISLFPVSVNSQKEAGVCVDLALLIGNPRCW